MTYDELPPKCRKKADVARKAIDQEVTKQAKQRACRQLNVCNRILDRYINACRVGVFDVFVHCNTERKPVSVIPRERREEIRRIYLEEFSDASFTHFCEILRADYGIKTSASTLEKILKHEAFIVSPLAHRSTVIKYSRKLKKLKSREEGGAEYFKDLEAFLLEMRKAKMDAIEAGKASLDNKTIEDFRKRFRLKVANGLSKFKQPKRCRLKLGKIPEGKTRSLLLRLQENEDAVFKFLEDFYVEYSNNESLCEGFGNAKVSQSCFVT